MTQKFNELPGKVNQRGSPLSECIIKNGNGQRNVIIVGSRERTENDSGVRLVREEPLGRKLFLVTIWKLKENSGTLPQSKETERLPATSPFPPRVI